MCQFFSFVGDGYGNFKASFWDTRQRLLAKHSDDSPDSHTWLLRDVEPRLQNRWSRYEYNPLTKVFRVDQGVEGHDHDVARKWVESRDWSMVCEPLIIKPIVNPFTDRKPPKKIIEKHLKLLKEWASVRDSVRAFVWDSVRAFVWASVRDSVGASVWASVGASVRDSVRDSVWASVWAYASSFVNIPYSYDFSSAIKLWDMGLVPSFDGTTWRLHGGKTGKILWEGKI